MQPIISQALAHFYLFYLLIGFIQVLQVTTYF